MAEGIKFPRNEGSEFYAVLRTRVNKYFKENNIDRYGNRKMYIKTAVLLASYAIFYALIITRVSDSFWVNYLFWAMLGFAIAGIGLSVMHDASHGAYSKKKSVNKWLANSMTIIGGSAFTWNIQHNQLHHSYTNVDGVDEDIDPGPIMRFSPHKKRYWIHKFQHIYAWFFYGLMTVTWSTEKDFRQLYNYKKSHNLGTKREPFSWVLAKMIFNKVVFHTLTIVLPLILLSDPWYVTLLYVFSMHFVAGFVLACVFQPAHVMPTSEYPLPNDTGSMENTWAIHQMLTTANFSPDSKIFSWYVGGLNYQIEHHLFPNICHIHHKALSPIVRQTAEEFGLPYNVQPNFAKALYEHGKFLKMLGTKDTLETA